MTVAEFTDMLRSRDPRIVNPFGTAVVGFLLLVLPFAFTAWVSVLMVAAIILLAAYRVRLSGWFELTRHFRASAETSNQPKLICTSARVDSMYYSAVFMGGNATGLLIKLPTIDRLFHSPVLIPWREFVEPDLTPASWRERALGFGPMTATFTFRSLPHKRFRVSWTSREQQIFPQHLRRVSSEQGAYS